MDADSSTTDAMRTAVANLMRIQRAVRRWTQDELAEKSGISRRTIQRLEKGEIAMDIKHLQGVSEAFGMHWLEFMKRVNDEIEEGQRRSDPNGNGS